MLCIKMIYVVMIYAFRWERTLILNCPYVVFGQDMGIINQIKSIRDKHSLPSVYAYLNITEHLFPHFPSYSKKYMSKSIPSKEVAMIWWVF